MEKLKVLDLFSGIGGFSLGLDRTGGFETVAFCEIEDFPRRVIAKHWPDVPCHKDVTELRGEDVGEIDVICGGFPCQDISVAGRGAGIDGNRSGLWRQYARLIGELRPRYVIVENVSALLGRGLGRVLGDLAALGYDAEWHCIPASAVGAPHQRDRVWIVAYSNCRNGEPVAGERPRIWSAVSWEGTNTNACGSGIEQKTVADTERFRQPRQRKSFISVSEAPIINRQAIDAFASSIGNIWGAEPNVNRS